MITEDIYQYHLSGFIHRDGEYTVEYSQWRNVHGKLSDCEHSEIKNSIMFSMSSVLKPITCTQLLNLFYVYIYVPFLWAILDQIQYSLDFCHVTSFHGNKGSLNSLKKNTVILHNVFYAKFHLL